MVLHPNTARHRSNMAPSGLGAAVSGRGSTSPSGCLSARPPTSGFAVRMVATAFIQAGGSGGRSLILRTLGDADLDRDSINARMIQVVGQASPQGRPRLPPPPKHGRRPPRHPCCGTDDYGPGCRPTEWPPRSHVKHAGRRHFGARCAVVGATRTLVGPEATLVESDGHEVVATATLIPAVRVAGSVIATGLLMSIVHALRPLAIVAECRWSRGSYREAHSSTRCGGRGACPSRSLRAFRVE